MNELAAPDEFDGRGRLHDDRGPAALGSTVVLERTIRTSVLVPNWAAAGQVAEAMEILDTTLASPAWRGAVPGWGATTIYSVPAAAPSSEPDRGARPIGVS